MYERETRSFEAWEEESELARAEFMAASKLMVKSAESDTLPDYLKPSAVQQWESHALRAAARLSKALKRATAGVQTRRGWHVRYETMRHGEQSDEYGEHRTVWCVLDVGPDIDNLRDIEEKLAFEVSVEYGVTPHDMESMDYDELDRVVKDARREVQDRMLQHIQAACKVRYGWEPYPREIHADYTPTGQWFSHVYYEQRGQRVLVEQCSALDI